MFGKLYKRFGLSVIISGAMGFGVTLIGLFIPYTQWDIPTGLAQKAVWVGVGLIVLAIVLFAVKTTKSPTIQTDTIKPKEIDAEHSHKAKAHSIHSRLIELETELWIARDKLSKDEDPQDNAEVKRVLANIKSEVNNLAILVNNHKFEELTDAVLSLYIKYLEHHANAYEHPFFNPLNIAHGRIRRYINNKVKD